MRVLHLLIVAAACVAFSVRSSASVNSIGYVDVEVPSGLSLLTHPLQALDSRVSFLSPNGSHIPDGAALYLLRNGSLQRAEFNATLQQWLPAEVANLELLPGEGFFLQNPTKLPFTITFVGEVRQGTLTNHLPEGFSLRASLVPQAADLDTLGFPAEPGDEVFIFNTRLQRYEAYFFDDFDLRWQPAVPRVEVGQAFFVFKSRATDWIRTFSIIEGSVEEFLYPSARRGEWSFFP